MLNRIFIIAICLLLAGCYQKKPFEGVDDKPVMKPHPVYYLTLKLANTVRVERDLSVDLIMTYQTTNPDCDISTIKNNDERKVLMPRVKIVHEKLSKNDQILKIPLDRFQSGFCQWQAVKFYYQFYYAKKVRLADANTSIDFMSIDQTGSNPIQQYWMCDHDKCTITDDSIIAMPIVFSLNSNHFITLNFQERKK